jgi:hypothetical protein
MCKKLYGWRASLEAANRDPFSNLGVVIAAKTQRRGMVAVLAKSRADRRQSRAL